MRDNADRDNADRDNAVRDNLCVVRGALPGRWSRPDLTGSARSLA